MEFIRKNYSGILVCLAIAIVSWLLGKAFPIVGGAIIAIVIGMIITLIWKDKGKAGSGIKWTSKYILQSAVVLLGFGMNLGVIFETGKQSLPIIVCTIATSLIIAFVLKIFAGTAINDTSSVTAAATTWDSMWNLGSETLNKAVTVKLTRTLAIIPITLVLSFIQSKKNVKAGKESKKFSLKKSFPMFILYFVLAAVITTVCVKMGVDVYLIR